MIEEFYNGDNLLRNVGRYSAGVLDTCSDDGKDIILTTAAKKTTEHK